MDYDLRIFHILSSKVKVRNSRDAIGDLMINPMERNDSTLSRIENKIQNMMTYMTYCARHQQENVPGIVENKEFVYATTSTCFSIENDLSIFGMFFDVLRTSSTIIKTFWNDVRMRYQEKSRGVCLCDY